VTGHLAHRRLGEGAGRPGGADEGGGLQGPDHGEEIAAPFPETTALREGRGPGLIAAVLDVRLHHEAVYVHEGQGPEQVLAPQARAREGRADEPGDPDPRRPRPHQDDPLRLERRPRRPTPRQEPGQGGGGRPLDVVIERRKLRAIAI
jgi:hypothetical protein